jgi:hypothetical protein
MTMRVPRTLLLDVRMKISRGNGTYLSEHEGEDAGKYLKRNGGG